MPASLLTTRLGADGIPTAYVLAGVVLAWLVFRTFSAKNLRRIPTEGGPSLPIISFIGLYTFLTSGKEVLQRGYEARKGRTFKVALIDRWLVVLSGKALVEELQKMPDDTVESATAEIFEMHHVFGVDWHKDPVHLPLLRSLTRNLGVVFVDMFEEMETAFRELVPAHNDRWVPVHVSPVFSTIVTRAANRVFVGQPICRDGGYVHMMLHVAEDVTKAVALLTIMPAFLKGLIARKATVIDTRIQQCLDYLRPAIDDRMAMMARFGKEWDKPNDLLQWTIDEVTARNWTPDNIARIILFINFGAIETTSHAIIHALYDIAVRPEVAAALREEAEIAVAEAGWTKAAMTKMRKLDSFLRESQRMNGPTTVSMFRHVLRPVTLSDGTHLPAGTTVVTPTLPTHLDGANYADAGAFDALRFYRAAGVQPALVTTSADYITFGHGKHACPGRFFAANELKAALAYVLVHYDVKPEHDGVRPPNVCNGLTVVPDAHARVLFRKRQTD
ncbi:cytochrome P450 [Phanerochaete sordida]|uniref:Cytochrome P450 n=1 Tax=Phanerochaete sordida TaxID=48140 RepID=A0A9P3GL03_9APHY|nr:cytochrome P450 [Phanerochaete sordida]